MPRDSERRESLLEAEENPEAKRMMNLLADITDVEQMKDWLKSNSSLSMKLIADLYEFYRNDRERTEQFE